MRIIVEEQKWKDQFIKESKYINTSKGFDRNECPNLSLLWMAPDIIEVEDEKIDYDRVLELQEKLKEYANWEGTEVGEMTTALIYLSGYPDYISDSLWRMLVMEMELTLKMFENGTEIVETEETFTRTVKELVWKDGR